MAKALARLGHERTSAHTFEDLLLSVFPFRMKAQAREISFHYTRLGEAGLRRLAFRGQRLQLASWRARIWDDKRVI